MKYYIFLDDSGQLHKNYPEGDYFIYGGLLVKESDFHGINKSYRNLIRKIKREKRVRGELKTTDMDISTRRRLLKRLAKYSCDQVFVSVRVPSLKRLNFYNKRDVARFKNYLVRRLVDDLISSNKIPNNGSFIELNIDNQNVAYNSRNSLEDHLYNYFNEENYHLVDKSFNDKSFKSRFKVHFKDSATNYLIQAADLLANTKFNILQNDLKIRNILKKNYTSVRLP